MASRSPAAIAATLAVFMGASGAMDYVYEQRKIVEWNFVWEEHMPYKDASLHYATLFRAANSGRSVRCVEPVSRATSGVQREVPFA
jgi:hypothetical protein